LAASGIGFGPRFIGPPQKRCGNLRTRTREGNIGFSSDAAGMAATTLPLAALSVRLACVAPDAQRPQVAELVGPTLGLRHDVVYLGFTLVGAQASAVLALPCVTD
jgi:hypothetical protein